MSDREVIMAYLSAIISQIEQHFNVNVEGIVTNKQIIEGIYFLSPKNSSSAKDTTVKSNVQLPYAINNLLFIGSAYDFDESVKEGVILLLNCPKPPSKSILWIKEALNLLDVFQVVQNELMNYHSLQLKREELFHSLYSGTGIDGIINVAHTYLENPITICDTSFSILSSCPPVDDSRNLEKKKNRFYLKEIFSKDMIDSKIVERIYLSRYPFITKIEDFTYDWIFSSIRIQHAVVGYACIRAIVRPFTDKDLEFIQVLSQMLSIEMQKDNAFSNPTGLKYEYFLTELLEGNFERTEAITHQLIQLGHKPTSFYYLLVFYFRNITGKRPSTKYYYDQLLSILPHSMVVLFHNRLTVLLGSNSHMAFTNTMRAKLTAFLKLNQMYVSISYPFSYLADSPYYFQQSNALLSISGVEPDKNGFIYYDQYYLNHIFSLCRDSSLLKASIHPNILQIQSYDLENHTEYLRTLRTYLSHNRNAVSAAQELHIHKSTFFYRLSKISDLFHLDVSDGLTLFAYEYSFQVLDYFKE